MNDASRDGEITFDQPDQPNPDPTSAAKPYRFWVNNDNPSKVKFIKPCPRRNPRLSSPVAHAQIQNVPI